MKAEWRVFVDKGSHVEVHCYRTEKAARRFAAKQPVGDIQEGGLQWPKPPTLTRVVWHTRGLQR